VTRTEAEGAIRDLVALPFVTFDVAPILVRAFQIAHEYNRRSYDCIYIALDDREGMELWTGDQRLYNALNRNLPFVRWIGDYQRRTV
jgi:predicted nucleic acid-binding protein